jgi:hypothetical protein
MMGATGGKFNTASEVVKDASDKAQYGVSKVPYHTHNNVDSPNIVLLNNIVRDPNTNSTTLSIGNFKIFTTGGLEWDYGKYVNKNGTGTGILPNAAMLNIVGPLNYIASGSGVPTYSANKGTLYINETATTATTRLYINIGGSTWANFTASA